MDDYPGYYAPPHNDPRLLPVYVYDNSIPSSNYAAVVNTTGTMAHPARPSPELDGTDGFENAPGSERPGSSDTHRSIKFEDYQTAYEYSCVPLQRMQQWSMHAQPMLIPAPIDEQMTTSMRMPAVSYGQLTQQEFATAYPAQYGYMPLQQENFHYNTPDTLAMMPQQMIHTSPLNHFPPNMQEAMAYLPQPAMAIPLAPGVLSSSPTDHFSGQISSSSESGWTMVEYAQSQSSLDSFTHIHHHAPSVSNPSLTLHIRSDSDSSHDGAPLSASSNDSFEHVQFPMDSPGPEELSHAITEAEAEADAEPCHSTCWSQSSATDSPSPKLEEVDDKTLLSRLSPSSSSEGRKKMVYGQPASSSKRTTKTETGVEKKIGKRRGPLRPEQRIQAGEIRKLRACLRCKFLKKTCDKNEVCAGCKPSHTRLWQVPCTRVDIKDLAYFLKDWTVDHERHEKYALPPGCFVDVKRSRVKHYSLWVSHGYGFCFPIEAHEAIFREPSDSVVRWSEQHGTVEAFDSYTANLVPSKSELDQPTLNEYLDAHVGSKFPDFVDKHFQGTKFLSEMLVTAYDYYNKSKNATVKKALKLVVAYNLTTQIAFLESTPGEMSHQGKVLTNRSYAKGKQVAPTMVNESIKHAMAAMWRELQSDVLKELSTLFASVYSRDKLKNWPTIFIVATLLLAVWEEMQFDAHYREPDQDAVDKFCQDMESTPVGVITGLFSAISQKVPSFFEWKTEDHHHVLGSDEAACKAMSEVRAHVTKHATYLRGRSNASFDPSNFDCLSNKFLSKLVLRNDNTPFRRAERV